MAQHDNTDPSKRIATWTWAGADRPYCSRPWRGITVLSDGDVICACPDVSKTNPLGNVFENSVKEVWNGPGYAALRRAIEEDIEQVPVCVGCPMRIAQPPPKGLHTTVPMPRSLYIETVAGCNLICPGCDRKSIESNRKKLVMDYEEYTPIIDQLSPDLLYVEFYVGGENWAQACASEMVKYCKDRNPKSVLQSSTNGLYFNTDERARDCVESGIDVLVFSIDGTTQEIYEKGKGNGDLERALDGMRRVLEQRDKVGRKGMIVVWRYILYEWNSRAEQMDEARRMAREMGVDYLTWHLNADRIEYNSERYYVGSPHLHEIEHELWDTFPQRAGWTDPVGFFSYPTAESQ
ncbi:MAG: radical SAM protein [Planctomycetota bacterium]|jgi:MoaA/NifB/PqqE/SkfB family radical SAM enzyme